MIEGRLGHLLQPHTFWPGLASVAETAIFNLGILRPTSVIRAACIVEGKLRLEIILGKEPALARPGPECRPV
eukprot:scaffold27456_cov32-Tisochrysis_lutea.AAC.7